MHISLQDLDQDSEKLIEILGDEPWLDLIYDNFPTPLNREKPVLRGWVKMRKWDAQFVKVKAFIDYRPFVDCSRCSVAISWQIHEHIELDYVVVEQSELEQTKDLSANDLDACLIFGGVIDLASVLNDCVLLAIPSRTVPEPEDEHFSECLGETESALVYSSNPVANSGPFAILGSLK